MSFLTRRRFLRLLGGAALAGAGSGLYARWGEPHWLAISRHTVPLGDGARPPLRLVQLSDFHASPVVSFEFIARSVALALAEQPDAIALTGDFFTNEIADDARLVETLRPLAATAPTFACLGNHDGGPWTRSAGGYASIEPVLEVLRAAGIVCLHNDAREIALRGQSVQFVGVGDLWSGMCEPGAAFARTPPRREARRILLNHNPDAKDLLRRFDWDLVLCGHTHGGQLRLPVIGSPFAPVRDKRFVRDLHRWENRWLHVSAGVGNLHGVRFGCRPEINVLEIG